ncbi:I78 family peptidase inhibitor [Roseivivax sediminis]|uniref:Peptidase inhibitor I78 family protein n=1 Tax=Roseivivax sediminis TaxID=936889 RepID=A0A1I2BP40_9RHOB|nr:I78 family peptidase inhibitor [Roseivivax sediminis]SFE57829.1 Peptidase inhibitor I78 family protein [Roseivivax sediminis]
MSRGALPLLALVLAASCAEVPSDPPAAACTPGAYDSLVGRSLAAVTLPADLPQRVIRPGEMVTMEYRADRLTLEVDEGGTITAARCG